MFFLLVSKIVSFKQVKLLINFKYERYNKSTLNIHDLVVIVSEWHCFSFP